MNERRNARKIMVVLAVLFFASAGFAANLSETGQNQILRWKNHTVVLTFSNSLIKPNLNIKPDSDVKGALSRSLETWEKAADIKFEFVWSDKQTVSPKGNFGDGISLVSIAQTPENLLMFSRDAGEVSARTRIFFNKAGFITEADIILNPYQQFSTDGTFGTFDLETTLTHEIGHLLGLEHSPVLGATMFAGVGKNGVFNLPSLSGRTLGQTDISAVRALYGDSDNDKCCGIISGSIEFKAVKSLKNPAVWAQEEESGRIMAQVSAQSDGNFSIGGLPPGKYRIFCQKNVNVQNSLIGEEIGTAEVKKNKSSSAVTKFPLDLTGADSNLQFLGFNGQLSDLTIPLNAGKTYTIFIGGKNLNPKSVKINFDSPYIKILPNSLAAQDFGTNMSVVSLDINITNDVLPGEYSLSVERDGQSSEYLPGAISIEDYINPWNSYILGYE